ncbi:MAG: nucleotidyltransferase domain-containing protein, partial [bacterium]
NLDPDLIDEIVQRLVNAVKPEKIYLFGSHAYGQPHDDSDVDLFIVVNDSDLPIRKKVIECYRALKGLHIPKDIKVVTQTEFTKRSQWISSIERIVAEKGKLLYVSNL